MKTTKDSFTYRLFASLVVLSLVLAACGGETEATTTPGDTTTSTEAPGEETTTSAPDEVDRWGEPETTEIVYVNRLPNVTSNAMVAMADANGYLAEEGLTQQTAFVEDVNAALVGGSAQIGAIEPGALMQARAEGIDLVVIAGLTCRQLNMMAIQPDIETASDLAGEDVLVGGVPGSPDADFRLGLLELNGWDLRSVEDINYVTVPGGSDAWTELFYNGDLAVTPFFGRHREGMEEYGANIAVDMLLEWPNTYLATTAEFADANPNTIGRLVRALMRSQVYWLDPANEEDVFSKMADAGYDVTDAERSGFESQKLSFCESLYVSEELTSRALRGSGFPEEDIAPISEWARLDALLSAQEEFGFDNEPSGDYVTEVPGLEP